MRVEPRGDRGALGEDLAQPVDQQHLDAAALQLQAGLAAAGGHALLVAAELGNLVGRVERALVEQAVQQEDVDHAHRGRRDAGRHERIEVHAAHLDVLDAAFAQRVQRALAREDHALGADGAVELVLDLQQAVVQLVVRAVGGADAQLRVGRVGAHQSVRQRGRVAVEAVVAHRQRGLRVALVAEPAHAQRRGVRHEHRVLAQRLQVGRAVREAARHRRRRAEQVQQQERMAAEVADQAEVLGGRHVGQRPVVVDARDRLHAAAVAMAQPHAIDRLGLAHVGLAVLAQRDLVVGRQRAGHAAHPHHLVAERAVDGLVHLRQFGLGRLGAAVHAGDQLELSLAEVGGDVRVRQRGAECARMRGGGERARLRHAQAFLLHASPDAVQASRAQCLQAFL